MVNYIQQGLEQLACKALTTNPLELISIIKIREEINLKFGDLIQFKINFELKISEEEKVVYFNIWLYFLFKVILDSYFTDIIQGDAIIVTDKSHF